MQAERSKNVPYGIRVSMMDFDDLERQKWAVRATIGRTRLLGRPFLSIACGIGINAMLNPENIMSKILVGSVLIGTSYYVYKHRENFLVRRLDFVKGIIAREEKNHMLKSTV